MKVRKEIIGRNSAVSKLTQSMKIKSKIIVLINVVGDKTVMPQVSLIDSMA